VVGAARYLGPKGSLDGSRMGGGETLKIRADPLLTGGLPGNPRGEVRGEGKLLVLNLGGSPAKEKTVFDA